MDRVHKLKEAKAVAPEELGKAMEQAATATAAVKSAKVEVDRARLELEATQVVAPMSGRVGRPLVEPGALVFRGPDRATLLTTVTSLDPIGLTFDMDERSFLEYQRLLRAKQVKGAGGVLRMGLTGEDGYTHEGTLDGFEDRFSPQSGAVRVRGRFPNPDRLLLPGMFARVRLTFGLPRAVLEVPAEAVFAEQGTAYVLVANEHNVAERRAVTLGPADQGIRVVEKGLCADDWVVIAGLGGVRAGDPVEPRRKAPPQRPDPGRDPRR